MAIYATGVDYSNPQTPPRVLLAHGARFACRYASEPGNPKNLTADEAHALTAAGVAIVSVFETTAQRALAGYDAGHDDAVSARNQHRPLGLPQHRPIYFTVDFDMQSSQESAVQAYFHGVLDGSVGAPVGVYGGKRACEFLPTTGLVDFVWQTYAWSGGLWAATTHIRQVHNGAMWDGWAVDLDEAHTADYGQWGIETQPAPPPVPAPTNWTEHMIANLPELANGARDPISGQPAVHRMQSLVNVAADSAGIAVDGDFGAHTEAAVKAVQSRHSLTVDGIVGPHTWGVLVAGQAQ